MFYLLSIYIRKTAVHLQMSNYQALAVYCSLAQSLILNCKFDYGRFPSRQNITLSHSNQLSMQNHHHLTITFDSISCCQPSAENLPKLQLPFSPERQLVTVFICGIFSNTHSLRITHAHPLHTCIHTPSSHMHTDKHTHIPQLCTYTHSTKCRLRLSTKLLFDTEVLHLKAHARISASPCLDTSRSFTNIYRCNQPLFKFSFNFLKTILCNLSSDGLRTLGFQVLTWSLFHSSQSPDTLTTCLSIAL